jgi:hypothetical protein
MMLRLWRLPALLCLLAPDSGWAFSIWPECQRTFEQGKLDRALSLCDAAADEPLPDAVLAQVQLVRAQLLAAFGRLDAVDAAFEAALLKDPEAHLDVTRVQPSVVGMLEAVRARLRGQLVVTCDLPASAYVDAREVGPTPFEGEVPIGRHKVDVRTADGRVLQEDEVLVRSNVRAELHFSPPPPRRKFDPYVSARVVTWQFSGVGAGGDLGVVILEHIDVSAGVHGGSLVGFSLRIGVAFEELWHGLGLFAAVNGVTFVTAAQLMWGGGLVGGVSWAAFSWLSFFTEISGYALAPVPGYTRDSWLLGAGFRLRWPRGG